MPLMWLLSRLNVDLEAFQKYHQFLNKLFWKHYYSMWVDPKPQISVTFMHSERTMLVETENFIKRCLFLIVVAVQLFSCVQLFVTPWTAAHQASLSFTNSWSLLKHVHQVTDAIQPSHPLSFPFSSCPQSFPTSGPFPMIQLFAWGGQSIGVSASASVLPMTIQDWFPLGLTGLISLLSKELSRVLSNTTVQKHQFFGAQLSLQSNSHIHTWLLEKP